jgi:hypothetical protein
LNYKAGEMKLLSVLFMALFAGPALAQQPVQDKPASLKPRAVVELFTSQGCSSCPPADKLMGELAKDPSLIVLTLPVDYWDYLGWKDTLANPAFTARQRGYSLVRGDRQVYTPQVVINGAAHVVGSDRAAIDKGIAVSAKNSAVLATDVVISVSASGYQVSLSASLGASGNVWVLPIVSARDVQIGRGENSGRAIAYTNVARGLTRIAGWNGDAVVLDIPASAVTADADGIIVIVQEGSEKKPFRILGAGRLMKAGS